MPNNKNKEVENTLIEQDGDTFSVLSTFKEKLLTFKGKNIILYFYPRNFTSGCTKLACNFRDYSSELVDLDTIIINDLLVLTGYNHRLDKFQLVLIYY